VSRRKNLKHGLLIVSRVSLPVRNSEMSEIDGETYPPILGLSHDEAAAKYRGFEGVAWGLPPEAEMLTKYPFLSKTGIGSLRDFKIIRQILERDFDEDSDLIYLGRCVRPPDLPDDFVFAGYDFGICYGFINHARYSIIYDDIIYGFYPELRELGSLLNENLLLARVEDGQLAKSTRKRLEESGCALETFEELGWGYYVIGIWLYVRR
jgi:hypothetical protein